MDVEPINNTEVLAAIQNLANRMDTRFSHVDARLDKVEYALREVQTAVYGLERRVGSLEVRVEDVIERLSVREIACDTDSEAIISHEHRIAKLETTTA